MSKMSKNKLTSNLEEFKKQLEGNNDVITDDKNFEIGDVQQPKQQQRLIRVLKNIVLTHPSDYAGCGHIRSVFPMNYLNGILGKSKKMQTVITPLFIIQQDILIRTKCIWFQRTMEPRQVKIVERYKELQPQLKYKMVYDIDDYIFGKNEESGGDVQDGVPSYNFGNKSITEEIQKASVQIMNMMDKVTVSSAYLGEALKRNGVITPIEVLKNTIPMYFWGNKKRDFIKKKIEKPRVLWAGSPTHYNEPKRMRGDIDSAWCEYINKAVFDNKIEFIQMGVPADPETHQLITPFFFKNIEHCPNYKRVGWFNSYQYHLGVIAQRADFSIGPLVPNEFNRSKSDIKAIEAYASGAAFIGTTFSDGTVSPYDDTFIQVKNDCDVKEIEEKIEKYSRPENFNDILCKQYAYLVQDGRYTESPKFIEQLLGLIC